MIVGFILTGFVANTYATHTEYNGSYDISCDELHMDFSIGVRMGGIEQAGATNILNSSSRRIIVGIPISCDDYSDISIDEAEVYSKVMRACYDFEGNDMAPDFTEKFPCETIAATSTWLERHLINTNQLIFLASLDMNVRRSRNWFRRSLGFDVVDYVAVFSNGSVVSASNMLIDKDGQWGILNLTGESIPAQGEFQGVQLAGCGVVQATTLKGNVSVSEQGNSLMVNMFFGRDADCMADYEGVSIGVDVRVILKYKSLGFSL